MKQETFSGATSNMEYGIQKFIGNDYFKSLIPEHIVKTLELIVIYIASSKILLFTDGKFKSLSILNIVTWWKFIKKSRKFIIDVIEIWK